MGERIYGCDDCLDACPWNRFAQAARSDEVRARPGLLATPLVAWLALDEAAFARAFEGSAILRAGRGGFVRNVCIALGNRGERASVPALAGALGDPDPARARRGGVGAGPDRRAPRPPRPRADRRAVETDPAVAAELGLV